MLRGACVTQSGPPASVRVRAACADCWRAHEPKRRRRGSRNGSAGQRATITAKLRAPFGKIRITCGGWMPGPFRGSFGTIAGFFGDLQRVFDTPETRLQLKTARKRVTINLAKKCKKPTTLKKIAHSHQNEPNKDILRIWGLFLSKMGPSCPLPSFQIQFEYKSQIPAAKSKFQIGLFRRKCVIDKAMKRTTKKTTMNDRTDERPRETSGANRHPIRVWGGKHMALDLKVEPGKPRTSKINQQRA